MTKEGARDGVTDGPKRSGMVRGGGRGFKKGWREGQEKGPEKGKTKGRVKGCILYREGLRGQRELEQESTLMGSSCKKSGVLKGALERDGARAKD